jgi:hypothetical protein
MNANLGNFLGAQAFVAGFVAFGGDFARVNRIETQCKVNDVR